MSKGDLILTIETDKVSTELTADESGVLEIVVAEGEEVAIGALVARIDPSGTPTAAGSPPSGADATSKAEPSPAPVPTAAATPSPAVATSATPEPASAPAPEPEPASVAAEDSTPAPNLSVVPSVEPHLPEPVADTSLVSREDGRVTRTRMSPLRRKIATHLVTAQQTAAILTTFNECDMSGVMKLRKTIQESFIDKHGIKLGFMSFFIKAVVEALRDVPQINARIEGDQIIQHHYYDVGVAVGTDKVSSFLWFEIVIRNLLRRSSRLSPITQVRPAKEESRSMICRAESSPSRMAVSTDRY